MSEQRNYEVNNTIMLICQYAQAKDQIWIKLMERILYNPEYNLKYFPNTSNLTLDFY